MDIVFQGKSKKGREIIIRYPQVSDVEAMYDYINLLSKEKTFIRFQGETISMEEEQKYVSSQLEKISKKRAVQLLAFCDQTLVGNSGIDLKDRVEKHEGVFGISLHPEFRGEGIGQILMEAVINEAIENLPDLQIITLSYFANNPIAKNLYKKLGFVEYGILPKGIIHKGGFVDHVYMYKMIK